MITPPGSLARRLSTICWPLTLAFLAGLGCERSETRPGSRQSQPGPAVEAESKGTPSPASPPGSGPGVTIFGRVVYRGPVPEGRTMFIPEAGEIEAHTIVVDGETRGLKNAVVWVEDAPAARTPLPAPAVLDQRGWTFVPHIFAVRAGQGVRFLNSDLANHNVHSTSPGAEFNVATPSGTESARELRRATGPKPIKIQCDIHAWMLAWIYVFEHDLFAVTDFQGRFQIDGVPPGRWRLGIHHADGALEGKAEVDAAAGRESSVELEVWQRR